jgi:hypothetical protein
MPDSFEPSNSYVPLSELVSNFWPQFLGTPPDLGGMLDRIGVTGIRVLRDERFLPVGFEADVAIFADISIDLPFIPGLTLHAGDPLPRPGALDNGNVTTFSVRFKPLPRPIVELTDFSLNLSTPSSLLEVWEDGGPSQGWHRAEDSDEQGVRRPRKFMISLRTGFSVDLATPSVSLIHQDTNSLRPRLQPNEGVMLGSTGILIHGLSDLRIALDEAAEPSDRGLHIREASVSFIRGGRAVGGLEGNLFNCAITNGGFSGTISLDAPPNTPTDRLPHMRVFGIDCYLQEISVTFRQSIPANSRIAAFLKLPFFSDESVGSWLPVEASFSSNGELDFRLGREGSSAGVVRIRRERLFELSIETIGLRHIDQVAGLEISGSIRSLLPGVTLPAIRIQGLRIDANGQITIPGGMLRLNEPLSLNVAGFSAELRAISLVNERRSDGLWSGFGFSGNVALAEGLAAASFQNLRIALNTSDPTQTEVTCDAVSVRGRMPGLFNLSGSIALANNRFAGGIDLTFERLRGLRILANFIAGRQPEFTYWFFRVGLELPAGVPIMSTGLSLYDGKALAGQNWAALRRADEPWFDGWYLRRPKGLALDDIILESGANLGDTPESSRGKWGPRAGSWAFGAGVKVGTATDDGYVLSAELLVVVTLPGPVVFLEGRAAAINPRAEFPADPPFRAAAIIDMERGELTIGLDARFTLARVLQITGSAEAFFNFHDPSAWHLYIGRDEPESRRVAASILAIFQAGLYLMLDPRALRQGATAQLGDTWRFGPIELTLRARLDEQVEIFWQPLQLAGLLALQGQIGLSVCGVGIGISASARLSGRAPEPLEIAGRVQVQVTLFWPLPNFSTELEFRWHREGSRPPWTNPISGVHIADEITGRSFELLQAPDAVELSPNAVERQACLVPLDARPAVRFGRPIDAAGSIVSIPPSSALASPGSLGQRGEELPGIPGNFVSRLTRIDLARLVVDGGAGGNSRWESIAHTSDPNIPVSTDEDVLRAIWGSWRPMKDRENRDAAVQFELYNRYGFHFRDDPDDPYRGDALRTRARKACLVPTSITKHCVSFEEVQEGKRISNVFVHRPGVFTTSRPVIIQTVHGGAPTRALTMASATKIILELDDAANQIEVTAFGQPKLTIKAFSNGLEVGTYEIVGEDSAVFEADPSFPITTLQFESDTLLAKDLQPKLKEDHRAEILVLGPVNVNMDCIRHLEDMITAIHAMFFGPSNSNMYQVRDESSLLSERIAMRLGYTYVELPQKSIDPSTLMAYASSYAKCAGDEFDSANIVNLTSLDKVYVTDLLEAIVSTAKSIFSSFDDGSYHNLSSFLDMASRAFDAAVVVMKVNLSGLAPVLSLSRAILDARTARTTFFRALSASVEQTGIPHDIVDTRGEETIPSFTVAAAIRNICWTSANDVNTLRRADSDFKRFNRLIESFTSAQNLLEPDTTYRLEVVCSQENRHVAPGSDSWTRRYYFKTSGPPGAFQDGDPLDSLEPYLRATSPGRGETEVFRLYGIAIEFNRSYIPAMYARPDTELRLELQEYDGSPVVTFSPDSDGNSIPVTFNVRWEDSGYSSVRPSERLAREGLADAPCNINLPATFDARLVFELPDGAALASRHKYRAVLLGGIRNALREVAKFEFTTGKYLHLSELVSWSSNKGPLFAIPVALSPLIARMRAQEDYEPEKESGLFDVMLDTLGLAPRSIVPSELQTTLLLGSDGASILLIEFPQPLNFGHMSVALIPLTAIESLVGTYTAGRGLGDALDTRTDFLIPRAIRSADGTRLLVAMPPGTEIPRNLGILFRYYRAPFKPKDHPEDAALVFGPRDAENAAFVVRHQEVTSS